MSMLRTLLLTTALALPGLGAQAHDTWFEPLAGRQGAAPTELALGTGNRYPVQETGVGAEYLQQQGCAGAEGQAVEKPMQPVRNVDHALVLRLPPRAARCWAQLVPLDIELAPEQVAVYLQEVQASPALRATWREMQARGLPWKERYTKHARIDLHGSKAAAGHPVPMAMDIVRQPLSGGGAAFLVLRDGAPLAQQPVELLSQAATRGIWRRTDDQGRIELPALPAGRWLLRGTWLRLSDEDPTRWDSAFVTLAFEVAAPAAAAPPLRSAAR
jgi:hypothetical protein